MSLEDRLEVFKKIERERLRAEKEDAGKLLLDPGKRGLYIEEQADIFQRLVCIPCHLSI
jgi:hypothetical protein